MEIWRFGLLLGLLCVAAYFLASVWLLVDHALGAIF